MSKKRIPVALLEDEKPKIRVFADEYLIPCVGRKVTVANVFRVYQKWCKDHNVGRTPLSVGGFGRLLPKHYLRRAIWTSKGTQRGFIDYRLKVEGA